MKKISIFLALVIVISACMPLLIGASEAETISKAEAQQLIINAYRFLLETKAFTLSKNPQVDDSQGIVVNLDKYSLPYFMYFKVIEENLPGGSYENMCRVARSIYTERIAPYAYKHSLRYNFTIDESGNYKDLSPDSVKQTISLYDRDFIIDGFGYHFPLFYTDEKGVLYAAVWSPAGFAFVSSKSDEDLAYDINNGSDVKCEIIEGDSHSATAIVSFFCEEGEIIPPECVIRTVECKFVKTSDGWRIDESEYSVLCATSSLDTLEAYRASVSPSTGDTADERIALLGAVSLACIIPAACLTLKRRRRVAVD